MQGLLASPLILESEHVSDHVQALCMKILCETETACKSCRHCKKVLKNFHPDWIHLEAPFAIEDVRRALEKLRQKPFESKVRVMSFGSFGEASNQIQNLLLKTFEEPLAHWFLILGVQSRKSLLPTLRSRCLVRSIKEGQTVELSEDEEKLFRVIATQASEWSVIPTIDALVKDRETLQSALHRLLRAAQERRYPGLWLNLAPFLVCDLLPGIKRNLNPKIMWESCFTKALEDAAH